MKVFITGIGGFIGSTLAEELDSQGHDIFGVDNLFTGCADNIPNNIKWKEADIAQTSCFEDIDSPFDVVVHLAAQTSGEKSFEIPEYDMDTNIKGSYNVYSFARRCGAKLMVNMSSMSVYGDVPDRQIVSEDYHPRPVSPYGNSKLAAENMLSMLSKRDRFGLVSLRLFNAYGPRQNLEELKQGMVSIYLAQFLHYEKVIVKGAFERVRDFIYIDDIVNAIATVLNSPGPGKGIYNLCFGETTSVGELIELIRKISGIDKEIVCQGNTLGDVSGFGGNNSLFCTTFNWQPKVTIGEGLKKMISYYMQEG